MSLDELKLVELGVKAFFIIVGCFAGGLSALFGFIWAIKRLRKDKNGHNSGSKDS